jgi:hypothetical protein
MKQRLRRLTADEETQAEKLGEELGMESEKIKYFMRLPESLQFWDKSALARVLRNSLQHSESQAGECFGVVCEIIDALTNRVKSLEEKLGVTQKELAAREHKGVWEGGRGYEKGNFVTYRGGMWVAKKETLDEPGTSLESWRLVVRRGRDGRDGRDGYRSTGGTT